jgi:hypothetical protein
MQISHRVGLFELEVIGNDFEWVSLEWERGGVEREGEGDFKRGLDSEGAVSTLPMGSTYFLKG